MQYRLRNIKNWKLATVFSAILSLFGVITNSSPQSELDMGMILTAWLLTFTFLLIAWHLNSIITNLFFFKYKEWQLISKILIIIILNSISLVIFISISILIFDSLQRNREYNYLFLIVRGSMSISIIYLVQYTLNLDARNQSVILQNQMLKTENIRAQFEMLKQQISPHFLFNSLSTLRSMIRSSHQNAEAFVLKLSDVYRLVLVNKERDAVTLKEELEFLENYSFLLFSRYENMLQITLDIPDNLLNFRIPTFTLQLLLENCVKHNVISKEKPLHIKIYDSGLTSLMIENNLQKKTIVDDDSGHGLQNLIKRYDLLGISEGIQVFSDESVFRVKIKMLDP